jgi:hypothetical protein
MPHLNNKKKIVFGGRELWATRPPKSPISAFFKVFVPFPATSHGGGALVVVVVIMVRGAEVPGSNPRASPPWHDLIYVCFNI